MVVEIRHDLSGKILDIGGGGEGIIGRVYPSQVVAIDKSQAELDEAPDGFEKICMDATDLSFEDGSFEHATFFYSLMFIPKSQHRLSILEATRVLSPGGQLHIWDASFETADPFIVNLTIQAKDKVVETTYGVFEQDAAQSSDYLIDLCQQAGLELVLEQEINRQFYLCFEKSI